MFFVTKSIEDDPAAAPDLLFLIIIDPVGIGDIGEIANAETENGHLHVPYLDRRKGDIADGKRILVDVMQFKIRNARIFDIGKRIGKFPDDRFPGHSVCVKWHGTVLKKIICPDIIKTGQVILMRVSIDDCVESANPGTEHLEAKIRGSIDYNRSGSGLEKNAGAKPFVFLVDRGTHLAGAGYHGNARTGAGAQESNLDRRVAHNVKLRNKAGREHFFVYAAGFGTEHLRADL